MKKLFVAGALLAVAGSSAQAVVIYDSAGFEPTRFAPGTLAGQDGGVWVQAPAVPTGTALVQNAVKFAGNQAVQVTRATTDDRYWPNLPVVTPTPAQRYVTVDWNMNVTLAAHAGSFGPFVGIEAYSPTGVIAALGVDAKTGDVVFYDAENGGFIAETGTVVSAGTWHHYTLAMDFVSQSALLYVDGNLIQTVNGFVDGAFTQFSDADISALAAAPEPPAQSGVAYFDDYIVQNVAAVPEPASLACVGVGLAFLGCRRSRSRK